MVSAGIYCYFVIWHYNYVMPHCCLDPHAPRSNIFNVPIVPASVFPPFGIQLYNTQSCLIVVVHGWISDHGRNISKIAECINFSFETQCVYFSERVAVEDPISSLSPELSEEDLSVVNMLLSEEVGTEFWTDVLFDKTSSCNQWNEYLYFLGYLLQQFVRSWLSILHIYSCSLNYMISCVFASGAL